jgi:hypothetical protein
MTIVLTAQHLWWFAGVAYVFGVSFTAGLAGQFAESVYERSAVVLAGVCWPVFWPAALLVWLVHLAMVDS